MRKFTILLAAVTVLASSPIANAQDGDPEAGAKVFRKCAACHNIETDKQKVGPSLQGVIGRQPGTVEDFKYSKAMVEFGEGKVWNAELLTVYLAKPRDVVKGTRMAFAGLKKDEDIANVIAYVSQFSPSE
ncbi:cytochrome c family protein [Roseibium sp. FZY0029]|uniref:cytochrome c family protein n=1 Tax=Roseibium sp. FZY0029 TaxID=3116647 RepID=UPI002EB289B9|nr:cytochrome c family protein [Roseibium sp. FZY0029]